MGRIKLRTSALAICTFIAFSLTASKCRSEDISAERGEKFVVTAQEAIVKDDSGNDLWSIPKGAVIRVSQSVYLSDKVPVRLRIDGVTKDGLVSSDDIRKVTVWETIISKALVVLIHVLVIVGILLMVVFVIATIFEDRAPIERLLRSVAFGAGLLAYAASRAYGLSIPDFMAKSVAVVSPISTGFWGIAVPVTAGSFVAWFCLRMINRSEDVGKRLVSLFSTFVFAMFADVYATLAGDIVESQERFGLPNATFVLGVVLYSIFNYDRKN